MNARGNSDVNARGNSNHRALPPCTNFLFNSPGGKVVGGRGSRGRTLCRCPPAAYLWLAAELHGHGCLAVHQDGHRSADKRRARKGGKRSAVRNTRQQHKSGREQGVGHFRDWDPIDRSNREHSHYLHISVEDCATLATFGPQGPRRHKHLLPLSVIPPPPSL